MAKDVPRHNDMDGSAPAIDWAAELTERIPWLRLVVLARVRDRHAADEVMQEVALAAVAQKSPIRDRDKLGAWLRRLAVRQALMYLRRQGRRHRLTLRHADRVGELNGSSIISDTLDWLVRDERSSLIREAVKRLPSRDAEILLLKYLEGWSYQELAEHLEMTTSAVESRLHRARARLRNELTANRVIEVTE
jgi:RNA polymerase sigma factor (sigma-70 family)